MITIVGETAERWHGLAAGCTAAYTPLPPPARVRHFALEPDGWVAVGLGEEVVQDRGQMVLSRKADSSSYKKDVLAKTARKR